jgi:hypothetical protein
MLTGNGIVNGLVQSSQPGASIRAVPGIMVPVPDVKV